MAFKTKNRGQEMKEKDKMKSILLKLDEKFFYKMKADKQRREKELNILISWENYIKILFGFAKQKLLQLLQSLQIAY